MLIGNLDGMTVFARVVEERSFSGAARKLGMSKSAVSKHVTKLEDNLGIRLLNRTTRRLSLTDAGSTFYQHCARVVEEIETAEHALTDLRGTPRGTLRISAPLTFGQMYLPQLVTEFMEKYPGLHVDIHLADHMVDLVAEGIDMAIRITRLKDSSLIARKLADFTGHVVASPGYLEQYGEPKTPQELAEHRTISYTNVPSPNIWDFEGPEGQVFDVYRGGCGLVDRDCSAARTYDFDVDGECPCATTIHKPRLGGEIDFGVQGVAGRARKHARQRFGAYIFGCMRLCHHQLRKRAGGS